MAYSQAGHAPLPSGREWPGTTCMQSTLALDRETLVHVWLLCCTCC